MISRILQARKIVGALERSEEYTPCTPEQKLPLRSVPTDYY